MHDKPSLPPPIPLSPLVTQQQLVAITALDTVPARSLNLFAAGDRQASCLTYSGQDDVLDVAHAVGLVDALLYFCAGDGHHLQFTPDFFMTPF